MAVNVANFSELKSAVEDSGTTEILVTADIEFPSGGIKINTAKSSVVIDFDNHTVTDYNSLTFTNGIYIASTSATVSVTVKNAVWSGRNYYGIVGVYDGNTNCTITLENINYTGPQFAYNKNGVTIIRNCEVLLDKNGSSANPQEFCETNRVIIGGNVTVNSNSTSDAIFWFTNANASLVVEENAIFVANATSSYFIYADVAPVLLFKQNSATTISTKRGLFYASGASTHIASSFTLEKSASFIAYKFESNSVPMFKCQSNFTINENSIFQLYSENISSTALVYFGQTANISINSPSSLILYNRGGDVLSFQSGSTAVPNVISINAEMLRLWDIAKYPLSSAGNIQDTPTSEYHKANFAGNFALTLKTSTSQLVSAESTLTEGDTGYPLSATTLKFLTSKVISIGKLDLEIDEITDQTTQISGKTSENANLLAEYNTSSLTATAGANGDFSIPLAEQIPVDTVVSITTNKPFLTKTLTKKQTLI